MRLPDTVVSQGKAAIQSRWDDRVTVLRKEADGNVSELREIYRDLPCHFSQGGLPELSQSGTIAETELVCTLFVNTDVILQDGDTLIISHKGQTVSGVAGKPFHGSFSNSVKVKLVDIA